MATRMTGRRPMTTERKFFTAMALAVLLSTFVGFMPSYYLRGIATPYHPLVPLTGLVIVHGLVFSLWVLLFAAQTGLVAAGRIDLHRRLGLVGIGLVALMIPLALLVALHGIARPTAPPGISALSWAAVPLLDLPVFAGLIVTALAKRGRPQTHKRLMLIAMVDMMRPSLGRMPFPGPTGFLVLPLLFLLPLMVWDWRTTGRLHPATLWGSLAVAAVTIATPMVWNSALWLAIAGWMAALVA